MFFCSLTVINVGKRLCKDSVCLPFSEMKAYYIHAKENHIYTETQRQRICTVPAGISTPINSGRYSGRRWGLHRLLLKKSHDQTGNAAHTSLKGIMSAKDKQWAKRRVLKKEKKLRKKTPEDTALKCYN